MIINNDCLEEMKKMEDGAVDLTVTSPPYDNLRTYGGIDWGEHIWKPILEELYRVTKDGGVVVWVVGDATIKGSETGTSFKQALYAKECGFNLHDTMIYKTEKPPLTHKRYEQKFEYMFILTKGSPKIFNPLMEDKKYIDKRTNKSFSRNNDDTHSQGYCSSKTKKIIGNVWEIGSGLNNDTKDRRKFKHPAVFPDKLAYDHIISWSSEGDTVFDPMCGSGTVGVEADKLGRKFIGIEINKEYCKIAEARLNLNKPQNGGII
uniref:site-specific DNA-methyltransferase (cytosine-N(4)-specific) n=1 Tax=uncultured marine virus TaxID=186617 RepID=A0A0F7L5W8_9VIRU|nr:Modification methylase BamHII [uncultured marine virus]